MGIHKQAKCSYVTWAPRVYISTISVFRTEIALETMEPN